MISGDGLELLIDDLMKNATLKHLDVSAGLNLSARDSVRLDSQKLPRNSGRYVHFRHPHKKQEFGTQRLKTRNAWLWWITILAQTAGNVWVSRSLKTQPCYI